METIHSDVLVIGSGLTGLCIAYFLREKNVNVKIVEARKRIGGRIHTSYQKNGAPIESGATWLGKKHTSLISLLEELRIDIFEQELGKTAIYEPISTSPYQIVSLPPNTDPSFRIKGGSSTLINKLSEFIPADDIYTDHIVQSIEEVNEGLIVKCDQQTFQSKIVISTLPPNLFQSTITVDPRLPQPLISLAMETHTWMGESIKIGLRYKEPFWRKGKLSGTIMSNVGPIPEMYDHSNFEDTDYALKGFLNGAYFTMSKDERLETILKQLRKYYCNVVDDFLNYEELVWRKEEYTFAGYETPILPHQHNGHAIYQKAYLNNKLYIAGSETAISFPGYMEGAVGSAKDVCDRLVKHFSIS